MFNAKLVPVLLLFLILLLVQVQVLILFLLLILVLVLLLFQILLPLMVLVLFPLLVPLLVLLLLLVRLLILLRVGVPGSALLCGLSSTPGLGYHSLPCLGRNSVPSSKIEPLLWCVCLQLSQSVSYYYCNHRIVILCIVFQCCDSAASQFGINRSKSVLLYSWVCPSSRPWVQSWFKFCSCFFFSRFSFKSWLQFSYGSVFCSWFCSWSCSASRDLTL